MELDSELGLFAHFTMPDFADVNGVRGWLRTMLAATPRDPTARAGIDIADHVITGAASQDLPIRIYRPAAASAPLPPLIYFHGGSMIMGDLDTDETACLRYAREAGCAVVSVDYRLAPEHRFPAPVEDCYAAFLWATQHGAEAGLDPNRTALGGSSAGGALAAAVALMARDRGATRPSLQMLIYPALDDRMQTPSIHQLFDPAPLPRAVIAHMWRYYLGETRDAVPAYAAPARADDLQGLAPAYIEAGALDPLRDEAIDYAARLLRADVPTDLLVLAGAPHGFDMIKDAAITNHAFASRAIALRRALRL